MRRYLLSIETNETSILIGRYSTKKQALKQARYFRTGGLTWRGQLAAYENPNVLLRDTERDIDVYCKPLFKYALKRP